MILSYFGPKTSRFLEKNSLDFFIMCIQIKNFIITFLRPQKSKFRNFFSQINVNYNENRPNAKNPHTNQIQRRRIDMILLLSSMIKFKLKGRDRAATLSSAYFVVVLLSIQ